MKSYAITGVEAVRYPVVRITFEDGLCGEIDLADEIATGPAFAALNDEPYFRTVAVGEGGRSFGWNLDDPGHEIDFCPDATRILIETQIVEGLAAEHSTRRSAAE